MNKFEQTNIQSISFHSFILIQKILITKYTLNLINNCFNYKLQYQNNTLSLGNMSVRQSNFYSSTKDRLPETDFKTHRKNQFSFASPSRPAYDKQYDLSRLKFRSPLRQQQIQDYNRIKTQLKKGIEQAKQNISYNQSSHYVSIDEYNSLNQAHKYETERLLFEIQRLHQDIQQVSINKNLQIERLKQQHQKSSYLNMSTIRQNHNSQVQLLQGQLRKTKQLISDRTSQYQTVIKRQQRQIKHLNNQANRLNQQLRYVIQQKNTQIQNQQRHAAQELKNLTQSFQAKQYNLEQAHTKQINQLKTLLQHKQSKLQQYLHFNQIVDNQNGKLVGEIQINKIQALQKIQQAEQQGKQKYYQIKQTLQKQFNQVLKQVTKNYTMKQEVLQNEINKLKNFLIVKKQDRQRLLELHQQRIEFVNEIKREIERQNQELKNKLYQSKKQQIQQVQILKVKMTLLHQSSIESVVKTYESKLQALVDQMKQKDGDIVRLRKNLYDQTNHRYQMRKKYSIQVSKLNAKVIKLRSGISAMQVDMKQKIQNQRSMMLLTSRSIIKDVQSKTQNYKFYQQELRKLRQLFDLQQKQIQSTNIQVQEKIKIAQQQLERLSKKIIDQKNHHKQTQDDYKNIIKDKDSALDKLRKQLENIQYPQFDNSKQLGLIEQLKNSIHEKNLQNGKLKDECNLLSKKISIMKAQIDQYEIQHSISQEQAKKEYQRISKQNMQEFRQFYESRIKSLQKQKDDLKQLISSKQEKITSLVKKYQQLQKAMKNTLANINKRTLLQNRVMQLGIDNNLVKNMSEIVKNNLEEQM